MGRQAVSERVRVDPVYFTPTLEAGRLRREPQVGLRPRLSPALDMGSELLNKGLLPRRGPPQPRRRSRKRCQNSDDGSNWRLRHRTIRGSHGEVWRGTRVEDEAFDEDEEDDEEGGQPRQRRRRRRRRRPTGYVLKRMLLEKGEEVALAARGDLLRGAVPQRDERCRGDVKGQVAVALRRVVHDRERRALARVRRRGAQHPRVVLHAARGGRRRKRGAGAVRTEEEEEEEAAAAVAAADWVAPVLLPSEAWRLMRTLRETPRSSAATMATASTTDAATGGRS